MNKAVLMEINNVSKTYWIPQKLFKQSKPLVALKDVTFEIYENETLGIVGESGSGKSTLGRSLLMLEKPDCGEVLFEKTDLMKLSKKNMQKMRRQIQMIFQDPYGALNPSHTIGWHLEEPLRVHGVKNKQERVKKAEEMLALVGLSKEYFHRYPHELSGGQRQRIVILTAIMLNPKLIVADEAVSALDVSIQAQILNLLNELKEKFKLTYVFISHDLSVIHYFCDRILVMYLGHIVEVAEADTLFENARHPYTQLLLNSRLSLTEGCEGDETEMEVNSAIDLTGCPFATRCAKVSETCRKSCPPLEEIQPNHFVRCHQIDEFR